MGPGFVGRIIGHSIFRLFGINFVDFALERGA